MRIIKSPKEWETERPEDHMSTRSNEPRYQFWRTIQPVEGQPIPCWTQHKTGRQRKWSSYASAGEVFGPDCHDYEWRVRAPVIPEDVAVDAVMDGVKYYRGRDDCYVCGLFSEELSSNCTHNLRELVIAKLRELSQEAV